MLRFCILCLCFILWVFQSSAQIQTLHNTVAKGTLTITGGLHFQNIKSFNTTNSTQFSSGINYCFKHYFSIGLEASSLKMEQNKQQLGTTWRSDNLFLGINLQRNDHLFKTQMGKFKLSSIVSISGGYIFSSDLLKEELQTKHSSFRSTGYYTSLALGMRFEFVRRLFLEVKESSVYLVKNNVNLRTQDQVKISTTNWCFDSQIKLGIFMFIKTLDKCGTCPKW